MPISIAPNQIHIKKEDGSGYLPGNVVAGETTEEMCDAVEATGQATIDHVNQAIADAQQAVNTLDAQKNSIAETVASMAQLGTDTSLATPGMAADAAKTGEEVDDLKNAITSLHLVPVSFTRHSGAVGNDGTIYNTEGWTYVEYTINGESSFYVTGYGAKSLRSYLFFDASGNNVGQNPNYPGDHGPILVQVPANATRLVVNGKESEEWLSGIYSKTNQLIVNVLYDLKDESFIARRDLTSSDVLDNLTQPGHYAKGPNTSVTGWPFSQSHQGRVCIFSDLNSSSKYTFVQIAFDTQDNVMAYRSAYSSSWTDWAVVENKDDISFMIRSNLTSEDDVDDLVIPGTYAKGPNTNPENWPFPSGSTGRINVYPTGLSSQYSAVQVAFDMTLNKMAYRFSLTSEWNQWAYVETGMGIKTTDKIAIIGDSISTYDGWSESHSDTIEINGVSYPYRSPYYPTGNVDSVDKTWWKIICNTAMVTTNPVVSAVSQSELLNTHIINNEDASPAPWVADRVSRIVNASPDWIFINIGINDTNYSESRDENIPDTIVVSELESMSESIPRGLALLICKLRASLPNVVIVGIIPKNEKSADRFPTHSKVYDILEKVYTRYGANYIIDLRRCGITVNNAANYTVDGSSSNGVHPNAAGMQMMADYILSQL